MTEDDHRQSPTSYQVTRMISNMCAVRLHPRPTTSRSSRDIQRSSAGTGAHRGHITARSAGNDENRRDRKPQFSRAVSVSAEVSEPWAQDPAYRPTSEAHGLLTGGKLNICRISSGMLAFPEVLHA